MYIARLSQLWIGKKVNSCLNEVSRWSGQVWRGYIIIRKEEWSDRRSRERTDGLTEGGLSRYKDGAKQKALWSSVYNYGYPSTTESEVRAGACSSLAKFVLTLAYIGLLYITLSYIGLYWIASSYVGLHCVTQAYIGLHFLIFVLHFLHCLTLCYIAFHCLILNITVLHLFITLSTISLISQYVKYYVIKHYFLLL